jgi:hypothetical protein
MYQGSYGGDVHVGCPSFEFTLHASGSNAGQNGCCDRILRPEGVASACHVLHSCSSFGLRFYRGHANRKAMNELLVLGERRLITGEQRFEPGRAGMGFLSVTMKCYPKREYAYKIVRNTEIGEEPGL